MVFVPMAKSPPKAGAKLLYSPNLIHEFTSSFSRNVIYTSLFGKAFPRKQAFVDIRIDPWLRKQQPSFAQGQPKGYFQMKELDIKNLIATEAIVPMNEKWSRLHTNMRQYVPLRASMGQHCSLSAVQRKTAFGGTVMMGLNLKRLDQCHGVRSHGTSSSQSWFKRFVV